MRGIFVFLQYVLFVSCDEVAEDSVCFNKCSGHGTCKDFSCDCFPGWAGEDCNVRLTREEVVVPILSAGHINVTINTIHSTIQSYKHLVIGFSSLHCRACFAVEAEYKKLAEYLAEKNVMFARANADEMKSMCSKLGVRNLPALVVFHSKLPHLYRGVHSYEHFKRYIEKTVIEPPLKVLETIESVNQFKTFTAINEGAQINSVHVIGFFSDAKVTEEDEYEEFKELAQSLQSSEEIYFAVVARSNVSAYFKTKKLIDRTPSLLVITAEGFEDTISFDEIELKEGIREWIEAKTVPLVGRLEENNFIFYEKLNRPMLLLFLDLSNESHANQVGIIGGRSGGLLNEALLQEFRATAKEYVGSISFVFLDGNLYADKMKSLGLLGGVEGLPSMVRLISSI